MDNTQEKLPAIKIWQDPIYFLAFGFGSGLLPFAPGTWGTIAALPMYLLLAPCGLLGYVILTAICFVVGVYCAQKVSKDLNVHDHSGIVWDEIVGYLITMIAVVPDFLSIVLGFLLFRLFDIWKPFPISWVDKHVKGGLGIMLDDVLAAIPASIILQIFIWFRA